MGKSRKKDTSRVPSAKCFISTGTCPIDCSASQPTDLPHIPVAGSEADAAPPAKRPKTSGHASTKNAPNHRLSSKTQHKIPRTIETHNFANCARLVVPTSVVPLIQKCAIDDGPVIFYYRLRCTIGDILLSDFLSSYIKNNSCALISETSLDHEDVYAITDGTLYLSLQKSTFQRAGLSNAHVSKPKPYSAHSPGSTNSATGSPTYRLSYDLRDPKSIAGESGSASYNRLLWALQNTLCDADRDLYTFSLVTLDKSGIPSEMNHSLCRHFDQLAKQRGTFFEAFDLVPSIDTFSDIKVPKFQHPQTTYNEVAPVAVDTACQAPEAKEFAKDTAQQIVQEWALELSEWLALVELRSEQLLSVSSLDPHLSSYAVPEPLDDTTDSVSVITWDSGLIPPQVVARAWYAVIGVLAEDGARNAWAALTVHGVADSPVSWGSRPHGVTASGGENDYTLFKLPAPQPDEPPKHDSTYPYLLLQTFDASDP